MRRFRSRRRRRIWLLALFAACGLSMLFGGCADRLLLYPSTQPLNLPGESSLQVAAPTGNVDVCITRSTSASGEPDAFVLNFTGNASRGEFEAEIVADEWAGHSVEVWSVNYPGYGRSTGPAKMKSIPPAALAVYDALVARAGSRPIYLSGRSLGTTVALYVAAHRSAAGLLLQNPPPLQRLILQRHGWWNLWLLAGPVAMQVPADLNSLRTAPLVHVPAVFVLAERDTIVPPPYQQMVVAAYGGPKTIVTVAGADHNDPVEGQSAVQLGKAIDWLAANPSR
jgi:pimeloyl-ACP methyl ester carboxylesterase